VERRIDRHRLPNLDWSAPRAADPKEDERCRRSSRSGVSAVRWRRALYFSFRTDQNSIESFTARSITSGLAARVASSKIGP